MSHIDSHSPVAVAAPIWPLMAGAVVPGTVAAAHPAAVIVRIDAPENVVMGPRVVAILAQQASGVPNGVRTMLSAADQPFRHIVAGDAVTLGDGCLYLPGVRLRGVRIVATAVPHVAIGEGAVIRMAAAASASRRGIDEPPVDRFRRALMSHDGRAVSGAVSALVGLGAGSTPGGDDVLCGAMAGLHAIERPDLAKLIAASALPHVWERTTLLSADLLRLASDGNVCTEAGAVIRAAARFRTAQPGQSGLDAALVGLLAIGHTSGADLATGLAMGCAAGLAAGSAAAPPATTPTASGPHADLSAWPTPERSPLLAGAG